MTGEQRITVGMAQMPVEGGAQDKNIAVALEYIARAAAEQCTVVVLPECLDLGWTHSSALTMAQAVPGPVTDKLAAAAVEHGLHVVAGVVERDGEKIYNSSVLISPAGDILLKHRKINELSIAFHVYSLGTSLQVAETPFGTVGISICADNLPHSTVLGHSLGRMGAQLILSPSSWAVPADFNNDETPYGGAWNDAYAELARTYGMGVVGVSNVGMVTDGPWEGRPCIGASRAVGPDGSLLLECAYGVDAADFRTVTMPVKMPAARGTDLSMGLDLRVVKN